MPDFSEILVAVLLLGTAAGIVTELIKRGLTRPHGSTGWRPIERPKDNPRWWTTTWWAVAIGIATPTGLFLPFTFPWDLLTGIVSGGLTATSYAKLRGIIQSLPTPKISWGGSAPDVNDIDELPPLDEDD
jgi:hypothetical protein